MSCEYKQSKLVVRLGTLALAAMLAACGGGDDPVSTVGGDEPVTTIGTTATTVTLPDEGSSSGYTQTGTLNYLVFNFDGSTRTVPASVIYEAPNGTLTLTDGGTDLSITTTDAWANVTWPTGFSGTLKSNGNVGVICDGVGTTGDVGFSGNTQAVADFSVLAGRSFDIYVCGDVPVTFDLTFNADGSATVTDDTGPSPVTKEELAKAFSAAGLTETDGSNIKLRAFSHDSGAGTRYYIALIEDQLADGKGVSLLFPKEPR